MSTYGQLVLSDTSYAGEMFANFFRPVMFGAEILNGGHARVIDSVKKKITLPIVKSADLVQAYSAIPTATGSTTISGQVLEPQKYMIYTTFNPQDFADHWTAPELKDRIIGRNLPYSAENAIMLSIMENHTDYLNYSLMMSATGGTAPYAYFGGFIQKVRNASTSLKVAGVSAVTFTSANIVAAFESTYAGISAKIRKQPNFKFFVSHTTFELYATAQINQTDKGIDVTEAGVRKYKGIPVIALDMRDNTILGAVGSNGLDSNLVIGMNSMEDSYIQIAKLQANSDVMFFKLIMAVDTNIVKPEETILYYGA